MSTDIRMSEVASQSLASSGLYSDNSTDNSNHSYQQHRKESPLHLSSKEPAIIAAGSLTSHKDLSTAEESASDAYSTAGSAVSGPYQVIEYDFTDGRIGSDFLSELDGLTIEDNTPAAEAIRANAQIHVGPVAKAARAVNMQAVRKFVKRATGTTKSGIVRGKPPRIPGDRDADDDDLDHREHLEAYGEESEYDEDYYAQHERLAGSMNIGGNLETVLEESSNHDTKAAAILAANRAVAAERQSNLEENIRNIPENGHIPDSVVQGTVEASKKGRSNVCSVDLVASHRIQHQERSHSLLVSCCGIVLGAVDPHDLLKLLRWRRKKKAMNSKKTKSYVKGKVIDGEHELYTLSIAVMIGVRTSISKTNLEINQEDKRRWVKPSDFRNAEKYEFRPKGGGLTPPHQLSHTFKFKDYSPIPFAYLRRLAGVNDFDFLLSVCGNANFIEFISNAKSGQFFFYSSDGRFMIKTMTNAESKYLRRSKYLVRWLIGCLVVGIIIQ